MKKLLLITFIFLASCSDHGQLWKDGNYEVYWIDNPTNIVLGYDLDGDGYIKRIPSVIKKVGANKKYISAVSCGSDSCSYYFIDRTLDHKYANASEFVFGPYTEKEYKAKKLSYILPQLNEL